MLLQVPLMSKTYDAIVIGGGHNGLVAACYLAKAKRSVLVLERRYIVGGACVSEETFPGYKVSTAAYVNSLFRPEIVGNTPPETVRAWFQKLADSLLPDNDAAFLPRNSGQPTQTTETASAAIEAGIQTHEHFWMLC